MIGVYLELGMMLRALCVSVRAMEEAHSYGSRFPCVPSVVAQLEQ